MWIKKIKKKKLQCLLIASLIFLSALIFTSSLCMITSIKSFTSKYYSDDKIYDLFLYNTGKEKKDDVIEWCKKNSKVKDVQDIESVCSGNDIYKKEENLKISMYDIVPIEDTENLPFRLDEIKSLDYKNSLKEGEIWITQLIADNFNIKLGEKLTIKTKSKDVTLKVTSLINDSNQPASTSNQVIFYVNKNTFKEFSSFTKSPLIYINVKESKDVSQVEKDLNSDISPKGISFNKDLLAMTATMASSIVGEICTLASVLVFIVSIMLIRFILWNNILKEYKSIGIYKALGFSKKEILKFYIIGYSLTVLIGSTLGSVCSIPILNYTASKTLKYIGKFNGVNIDFGVIMAIILLFSLIVISNLYLVVRKTNRISPVEALRVGITSSKKKLTKSLIENSTSSLALGINDIFKYKKISILITITLTSSIFLVVLFGNCNFMISRMMENTNTWFGSPKNDVTISSPINLDSSLNDSSNRFNDMLNEIKNDDRVENYVYGAIAYMGVGINREKYNIKTTVYNTMVMNSFDKKMGFTISDGRNPEKDNEVSLSLNILKESGLSIGDYIELSINNKKKSYLITGYYNSLMSAGYSFRILNSAIQKELPEFKGSEVFLKLKDKNDIDNFKADINSRFPKLNASDIHPIFKYSMQSIPEIMLPITTLLMIVFIIFSLITVLNIIIMNVRDNRRNFGIMKALGFTSREIRNRYLYRMLILTLISVIIAITLNLTVSKPIIRASLASLDVLIVSPGTMAALVFLMICLVLIIIMISCCSIKSVKPTELMEE
ncbi:FtsX-like permease family protein [Clostridium sp. SHJSY1]|uniref:ABC transporter permease n=1 Tax=Clostridium sp. SHJSY1 TaxID=2942483 RepID=UPI0028753998|nr:FtsX-like permease family protein [Clostridium sp. SHJSY1]MDS0524865.1 FtsX-like permease family protein [Clostridium sp. SHJSY1]